jgi:3-isopropylmalate/(R)-2-methylmalate dehydratase small subunit
MLITDLRVRFVPGEISTDDIIPARYKHMYADPAQLAEHVFEGRFPGLVQTFASGDVLVGTETFGIGSSREQAVSALQACGIKAIIAPAFGRIFYRNSWNLGVPAVEIPTASFTEHETLGIDLAQGCFLGSGVHPRFAPPPPMLMDMIRAGGLLALIRGNERAING